MSPYFLKNGAIRENMGLIIQISRPKSSLKKSLQKVRGIRAAIHGEGNNFQYEGRSMLDNCKSTWANGLEYVRFPTEKGNMTLTLEFFANALQQPNKVKCRRSFVRTKKTPINITKHWDYFKYIWSKSKKCRVCPSHYEWGTYKPRGVSLQRSIQGG